MLSTVETLKPIKMVCAKLLTEELRLRLELNSRLWKTGKFELTKLLGSHKNQNGQINTITMPHAISYQSF